MESHSFKELKTYIKRHKPGGGEEDVRLYALTAGAHMKVMIDGQHLCTIEKGNKQAQEVADAINALAREVNEFAYPDNNTEP